MACLLLPACDGYEVCSFDQHPYYGLEEGMTSAAWHVDVPRRVSDDVGVGYYGSLTNRSTEADCAAAFYHFDVEPDPAWIPVLVPWEPVPSALEGGGWLVVERQLPRRGDHSFEVPVNDGWGWVEVSDDPYGDPELHRWVALALCADPEVTLEIEYHLVLCNGGSREPTADTSDMTERVW